MVKCDGLFAVLKVKAAPNYDYFLIFKTKLFVCGMYVNLHVIYTKIQVFSLTLLKLLDVKKFL